MTDFPKFLFKKLPCGASFAKTSKELKKTGIPTVCMSAACPNRFECYAKSTATFLALGSQCTRKCAFCKVDFCKNPPALDEQEPSKIAQSIKDLKLKHAVITMVTRDDLNDGGANHLVKIIQEVKSLNPNTSLEVLTSDFDGNIDALEQVLNSPIDIFNHNLETIRRLTENIRCKATYERSLNLLGYSKKSHPGLLIKSGIMVGLGETKEEVQETIRDLCQIGCDIITIGQYLQPSPQNISVKRFVTPEEFKEHEDYGLKIGIKAMYCGTFVRSSYNAESILKNLTMDTLKS